MLWIAAGLLVVVSAAALYIWRSRAAGTTARPDSPVDPDDLDDELRDRGIDLTSSHTPDPSILAPYIPESGSCRGAVRGRASGKRALVALYEDRLVAGLATAGHIGADVRAWPLTTIDRVETAFDIGGIVRLEVDGDTYEITHIPRGQVGEFEAELRSRIAEAPKG